MVLVHEYFMRLVFEVLLYRRNQTENEMQFSELVTQTAKMKTLKKATNPIIMFFKEAPWASKCEIKRRL